MGSQNSHLSGCRPDHERHIDVHRSNRSNYPGPNSTPPARITLGRPVPLSRTHPRNSPSGSRHGDPRSQHGGVERHREEPPHRFLPFLTASARAGAPARAPGVSLMPFERTPGPEGPSRKGPTSRVEAQRHSALAGHGAGPALGVDPSRLVPRETGTVAKRWVAPAGSGSGPEGLLTLVSRVRILPAPTERHGWQRPDDERSELDGFDRPAPRPRTPARSRRTGGANRRTSRRPSDARCPGNPPSPHSAGVVHPT